MHGFTINSRVCAQMKWHLLAYLDTLKELNVLLPVASIDALTRPVVVMTMNEQPPGGGPGASVAR